MFLAAFIRLALMSSTVAAPSASPQSHPPLRQGTVYLMAATVAVVVANIYYIQPLLAEIAHTFGLTVARAGSLAMLSQAGTALGMLFFVPLGDKFERRGLILCLLAGAILSLLVMALAPSAMVLALGAFLVGGFAACVHVVVPFAAQLASPEQRGRVVGTIVAGILVGVLLARTFSGTVGAWLGWRAVYLLAAGAMLLLAGTVRWQLPVSRPEAPLPWRELMASLWTLMRRHALLRESALLGALLFAAFSAFWTTLVFLLAEPPYSYPVPSAAAGLFGLVGALGALAAPSVGHLADKHGPRFTIRIALWVGLASFVWLGFTGRHLAGLVAGVIFMDLAVQSGHVSNQTRIYSIDPAARSRLNTVYMFTYFCGGGLGSLTGALCWHWAHWWGVCAAGAAAMVLAIAVEQWHGRKG